MIFDLQQGAALFDGITTFPDFVYSVPGKYTPPPVILNRDQLAGSMNTSIQLQGSLQTPIPNQGIIFPGS